MAHNVITTVLASAVADGGTFTVTYPTGYGKGNFIHGNDHRLVALQTEYKVGEANGFTISFGNSTATITWKGATTIPAESVVMVQLDRGGVSHPVDPHALAPGALPMHAVWVNLGSPVAADPSGICLSQAVSVTVEATLNGALIGDIATNRAVLDVPRALIAAWTTSAILTVKGLDIDGKDLCEKSASGTTFTGKKAFKEVTSVKFDASVTAFTLGTTDVLGLPVFLRDRDQVGDEYQNLVKVGTHPGDKIRVEYKIDNVELSGGTGEYFMSPVRGIITDHRAVVKSTTIIGGTLALRGSGNTLITGGTLTVDNSAVPGSTYAISSITGESAGTVTEGQAINVSVSGFSSAGNVRGYVEITASSDMGTYVVADQAEASGTSGDVRGTFDPVTTCDGIESFGMWILTDNPSFRGAPQFTG